MGNAFYSSTTNDEDKKFSHQSGDTVNAGIRDWEVCIHV